jgi:hypothetical protein
MIEFRYWLEDSFTFHSYSKLPPTELCQIETLNRLPHLIYLFEAHDLDLWMLFVEVFSECFVLMLGVVHVWQWLNSSLFFELPQFLMINLSIIVD